MLVDYSDLTQTLNAQNSMLLSTGSSACANHEVNFIIEFHVRDFSVTDRYRVVKGSLHYLFMEKVREDGKSRHA
ncbi:hypothetical protein DPMN_123802 [Dreissena polymorpha]|uniref:Uncharacterized protein n=1 Tax=Dreissena polymorpha TaxID=45954 RepID=A0A9D4JVJ4_DREPO|nr:hypothetical protein DPMN_123802 [Dreissena polymorpha]